MKKAISMLCSLAVFMILFAGIAMPITVSAETSGDFEYTILEDGTAEISSYIGLATQLVIPETIDGYAVTSIGDYAFCYCTAFTSITIPDSITSIGEGALAGCSGLQSVVIGTGLKELKESVFAKCTALEQVSVHEDCTAYCDIDGVLFDKSKETLLYYPAGKKATSYSTPVGTKIIGAYAFRENVSLESVTFSSGVTTIGLAAFWTGGKSTNEVLRSVTIPDSVTLIGMSAFSMIALDTVYYEGSEEEWNAIEILDGNSVFNEATIIYGATSTTTEPTDGVKGDVNGDGTVNLNDATTLFYYVNGLSELAEEVLAAADLNADGAVNLNDATMLFYTINGLV